MSHNSIIVIVTPEGSTVSSGMPFQSGYYPDDILSRLREKAGPLDHPLTNDRMFRGIFSSSAEALVTLASIFTGLPVDRITSVEFQNPISFGAPYRSDAMETIQDIRLLVNGNIQIDVEMQNYADPQNNIRFILYICRDYDTIQKGGEYDQLIRTVGSIILNYNTDDPCFFGRYHLINEATGACFLKNPEFFEVNVLQIRRLDAATREDIAFKRDVLAKLLLARTWEELTAIAMEDDFAKEVAMYMYYADADRNERVRLEMEKRAEERAVSDARRNARLSREAEEAKKSAEEARKTAEKAEKAAEEQRKAAEEEKKVAEEEKKAAEKARQEAQAARQEAQAADARLDHMKDEIDRLRKIIEAAGLPTS